MINRLILILILMVITAYYPSMCIAQDDIKKATEENNQLTAGSDSDIDTNSNNTRQNDTVTDDNSKITIEKDESLSLNKCVNIALLNNPEIKSAISNTNIYKARIGQAKSAYVPELSMSGGYSYDNATSHVSFVDTTLHSFDIGSIKLTQLIYDFGKTHTNIKIQETKFESSQEDLQNTINNVVYSVKKAYYDLLLAFQNKQVYEESVIMYSEQLKQAEAFYKVGERPKVDVLTAKVNLSNARLDLIKAQNNINIAYAALNNTMGIPESPKYNLSDELKYKENQISFEEILVIAYENRPDYKSALLKSESAKTNIKLAKTEYFPRMEAFSGYNVRGFHVRGDASIDTGWSVGASLKIPVLNIYHTRKKVDELRASYEKEVFTSEKLKNNIYLEVQQSYVNFIESIESVPVTEVALSEAKENYDLTNGRYKVGFGNHIELKDADLFYVNAKLAYYKALYLYNAAIVLLEKSIGQELPVK
ncbi:MAG: TolC family protein [Cyanobacteriota bacterium]